MRNNYSEQVPVRQRRRRTAKLRANDNAISRMGDNRELYIRVNCSHQVDDKQDLLCRDGAGCFNIRALILKQVRY